MLLCGFSVFNLRDVFLGRYDLDDEVLFCNTCRREEYLPGFWPGSVERHSQYLFDEDLFLLFDFLQKFNPGMSSSGFLHALEEFSVVKNRVSKIYHVNVKPLTCEMMRNADLHTRIYTHTHTYLHNLMCIDPQQNS